MKFEHILLQAGNGRFKVESAEDTFSKKGNPMLALKIRLYDSTNAEAVITEYMTGALFYKARNLLRAGGMNIPHGDKKAEWGVLDFEGKQGRCEIGIDEPTGNFPAKNIIKAYLEPSQDTPPPPSDDLSSFLG